MRREMCASALVHRAGRCPYTVSSIVYNRKDPLIAVGLSQLRTWWEAWTSSDDFRRRIQRAWPRIHARIRNAPSNRRWRRTHGPIGGIIATLTDHGWEAPLPDRWTSPGGTVCNLSDPALLSPTPARFSPISRPLSGTTFGWRLTTGIVGLDWLEAARHDCSTSSMEHAVQIRHPSRRHAAQFCGPW